jgi:DNA topoisomerase I
MNDHRKTGRDMSKKKKECLVIIESPAKARSLRSYLGDEYEIVASNGHVRDLPANYLGVDMDNGFKPTYTILPEKRRTVQQLKKKAESYSRIYLAADPDREGEAICWHLSQILERKGVVFNRLRFNAITRDTVLGSLKSPSMIDMQLVDAQQARRVMDRMVGYRVSSWLQRLMGKGRSAGRVQSVALRMIQEREDEINAFDPVEYWVIEADFGQNGHRFRALLQRMDDKSCCKPGKQPANKEEASFVRSRMEQDKGEWNVTEIGSRTRSIKPPPPFITSTLQQAASSRLSYSPSRTMSLAQQLYEGVSLGKGERTGLITYMRTDSVRISPDSLEKLRNYLKKRFGGKILTVKPRRYRSSKGSQDAHEAIRPVDVNLTPEAIAEFLTGPQLSLYRLIWNRFAATQLRDARVRTTKVTVNGRGLEFMASGEELEESGFSMIDNAFIKLSSKLPEIGKGRVEMLSSGMEQKFTSPPSRFTEARLVSEMKKVGIGRPSTYVSTIKTLGKRNYVEKDGRLLKPTELGTTTVRILVKMFPHIFQVNFTARMEDLLDEVAKGEQTYQEVLEQLNVPLEASLKDAKRNTDAFRDQLEEETGENCPECGARLVIRWGKYGKFKACTAFPKCRYSEPLDENGETSDSGRNCPLCGGRLLVKSGRYGRYLGCENHPKCRHTEPMPTGVNCPRDGCNGELVEKKTRRGRIFFGCSRYPDCDYALWNRPVDRTCPRCGFPLLEEKKKGIWCPSCRKKIEN